MDMDARAQKNDEKEGLDPESGRLLALLANNIRTFRNQRGITRKGLAEQSGVSLPHLARLEGSQGNVSVAVLGKVAKALNQPVSRLFAEEDLTKGDLGVIIEFLKQRPPEEVAKIRMKLFADFEPMHQNKADRIALVGLRGAGKSTVGRLLAEHLGRPFVELNKEVEAEAGIGMSEILSFYGQSGYRNLERRCLERLLVAHPRLVLATGGGIVAEPATYEVLLGACFTVWLNCDYEVYFQRVMGQHDHRIAQPLLYRDALDNIQRTMAAREHLYRMADLQVDTSQLSVGQVMEQITAQMAGKISG